MGQELYALVKSSSILLLTDNKVKTTAHRNQLWGEISRIVDGPVNAEVTW